MPRHSQSCIACDWRDEVSVKPYEHPPCPLCGSATERCWTGKSASIEPDDVPGGFWAENGFDRPTYFDSKKAHREALAARGLTIKAKWAGPTDQHLKRWDVPCAKTLENAAVLLTRGAADAKASRLAELSAAKTEFPITVTPIEVGR